MADVEDFIVDFAKEDKSGGGRFRVPDGKYPVKCLKAKPVSAKQKGTPGLELLLQITSGPRKGKKFYETLWATAKAYSRFRGLLEACDIKVPAKLSLVKLAAKLPGKEFVVDLETEEDEKGKYKPRSRVAFEGFINEADYDPDEDAPDDDGDEDEDEDEDDDEDDDTDDDEDEDEEEDEPEPPKRKAKKKAAEPAKKKSKKKVVEEDDDDEDDDLELDEL